MPEKIYNYKSDLINISYTPKLCIHAAECAHGLHNVFNPENRPWVNPEAGNVNEIIDVIKKCPTGALKYETSDGKDNELPADKNKITTVIDGPLYITGDISLFNNSGDLISRETRIALCRCGQSKNKPYCDNAHKEANFHAE